jgi:signal peptidase I
MEQAVVVAAALIAVAAGLLARRRLGFVTMVESESMLPTLAPGQRLLTRRPGLSRRVRRGDIVVIRSAELGRVIVKRVIGLPGEHVDVAAGEVRVDGKPLPEPYVTGRGGRSGSFDVPDGHLLLLGDNRTGSSDSRSWRQPYLPLTALRGTVLPSRGNLPQPLRVEDLDLPTRAEPDEPGLLQRAQPAAQRLRGGAEVGGQILLGGGQQELCGTGLARKVQQLLGQPLPDRLPAERRHLLLGRSQPGRHGLEHLHRHRRMLPEQPGETLPCDHAELTRLERDREVVGDGVREQRGLAEEISR